MLEYMIRRPLFCSHTNTEGDTMNLVWNFIKRESIRLYWTIFADSACRAGYHYMLNFEKRSGFFSEQGIPVPSYDEFYEIMLNQMALEGKL